MTPITSEINVIPVFNSNAWEAPIKKDTGYINYLESSSRNASATELPNTNIKPKLNVPFLPILVNRLSIIELNKTELIYSIKGIKAT